ncbi:glycoside hydrolase domain-containing protein [Rapidithrix thailandica]|uniref:Glycoside hydrolase domain-containing protein n=1 Tax=Rapidithrix thailandica TaxID=413964 RepID=A0AAW9RVF5_9BACT
MRKLLCSLLFVLTALQACQKYSDQARIEQSLVFEYVDPLEKVFPETAYFQKQKAHADVARGEHASFQLVVRSPFPVEELQLVLTPFQNGEYTLSEMKTGFVEFVRVGRPAPDPAKDRLQPLSGYYPDPIVEKDTITLPANKTQPIWVSVNIPKETATGVYHSTAQLKGKVAGQEFTLEKPLEIEVFNPVIDKTRLWVTNWYSLEKLKWMNEGKEVEKYSDTYWALVKQLARKMADYRQNVALIRPLDLTGYNREEKQWQFDFTNFNKMVELFIEEGVVGRIEGGHIGSRLGNWSSDFGVFVPQKKDGEWELVNTPFHEAEAREFYQQFMPALVDNLKNKGWYDSYLQHIADEPIESNFNSYVQIAKFVKKQVPDIKIIEACHTHNLENTVDVWVPQLNFMHQSYDFYQERAEAGDEIWYYTCLAPQGNYANRFIELPLIKTRILHWINFKYDIPGYLHWGLNFWDENQDPYGETSGIIIESGNTLPGGDAWIVYPNQGAVYSSIRLEAMRDGIVDHELLKMFEEKYPEEARELARQVVYRFDHYDTSIPGFREKRRKILERLSE